MVNLFKQLIHLTLLLPLIGLPLILQAEEAMKYEDFYEVIFMPEKVLDEDTVEIAELFLYTCPHCYHFQRHVNKWKKELPENVKFFDVPAVFSPRNISLAKAYYTAEMLEVLDSVHIPLFKAIHEEGKRPKTQAEIKAIFVANGVDEKAFDKTYTSFAVDKKVRDAEVLTATYGINAVPTVVVNGRYRIDTGKVQGYGHLLEIVNHLMKKELATLRKADIIQDKKEQKPENDSE